jgi:hypothetical protein
MILYKIVEIKIFGMDQDSRLLGIVYSGDKNINLEMVKAGFAVAQRKKLPPKFDIHSYKQAELEARNASRSARALRDNSMDSKRSDIVELEGKSIQTASDTNKIRTIPNAGKTNVKKIEFKIGNKSEKVKIHLESFTIPVVFDINGKHPRIVIDIHNVSFWNGRYRIPVNGKMIRQIRTYLHKKIKKQRIVLDLDIESSRDYSVTRFHDIARNVYIIEIQPAELSF